MRVFKISVLAGLVVLAASCGGGGGGGSGPQGSAETGVRVLHAAIDRVPFQLYSSLKPGTAVQTVKFAENALYAELPEGQQTLSLSAVSSPAEVLKSYNIEVKKKERRSVFVYGGATPAEGFRIRLLSDGFNDPSGNGALRVLNGADNAFAVTVYIDGAAVKGELGLGEASEYSALPPGPHNIALVRTEDGKALGSTGIAVRPGESVSLLLAGDADYFVKLLLLND